jgi:hypothetical protein
MRFWNGPSSWASVYVPLGRTNDDSPANTTGNPVTSVWKLTSAATLVVYTEVMTGGLAGLAAGLGLGFTGLVLLFLMGK